MNHRCDGAEKRTGFGKRKEVKMKQARGPFDGWSPYNDEYGDDGDDDGIHPKYLERIYL